MIKEAANFLKKTILIKVVHFLISIRYFVAKNKILKAASFYLISRFAFIEKIYIWIVGYIQVIEGEIKKESNLSEPARITYIDLCAKYKALKDSQS